MKELLGMIPEVEGFLALAPEELGAKILFALRRRGKGMYFRESLKEELRSPSGGPAAQSAYPGARWREVDLAFTEAWAWLEAQGLIIPEEGGNGVNGYRRLSRRAQKFENEAEFAKYAVTRMLPKEALHPKLATSVWAAFMRGELDVAVFQAMKAVEVAVKDALPLPISEIGVRLMRKAFAPKTGPLADQSTEEAEQEAVSALFSGAIGSYKSTLPSSRRASRPD